jgi:hypothetical protein
MSEVALLLSLIDEAFDHKAWHGTTLYGSLRGLTVATAAARPAPGRHNIWEIIVHAAYWKYTVRRRLTGEKRGSFVLEGSNWFERPSEGARNRDAGTRNAAPSTNAQHALKADLRLLVNEHRLLRDAIAHVRPSSLGDRVGQGTKAFLIRGIAAHDLYHAGQIQLIKRLVR